jgi:hypothetical protein
MSFRVHDAVPEAVRWRTYQRYPNPIYEMGSNLPSSFGFRTADIGKW